MSTLSGKNLERKSKAQEIYVETFYFFMMNNEEVTTGNKHLKTGEFCLNNFLDGENEKRRERRYNYSYHIKKRKKFEIFCYNLSSDKVRGNEIFNEISI